MIALGRRRLAVVAALAFGTALWARLGPLSPGLLDNEGATSTVVLDRHGVPLYEAPSSAGTRTTYLTADALPPALVAATLAAEDRRFPYHPGLDPVAMARAAIRNIRSGRIVEGASTITQQVAKLLLDRRSPVPRARGLRGKVREAVTALRLEHRLTKQQILALYFNLAPYGNQLAGAARASEVYFGVSPSLLTVAQAAYLAGLPQRPSAYSPYHDERPGLDRQRVILSRLERQGRISAAEAELARAEQLRFRPLDRAFVAPHFVEMVLRQAGGRALPRIQTTLDAALQRDVSGIIRSQRVELERIGAHNVAVVILDNLRGEWLAWEGSGDYFDRQHGGAIDGALARRQPGSALKPFTYALGFEAGLTPASVLPDVPASFPTARPGIVYTPRNYDGMFHGPLRIRKALAGSQNVPAAQLASRVGVPELLRFLKSLGFTTLEHTAAHYGVGLTLGNAEVTLAELVAAYSSFARGGVWVQPRAVQGAVADVPRRVMSTRAAYWIADVLADPEAREYAFGRGGSLEFPFSAAAKTGTSQAYRDNWTIGFTREITVGVWVGNFDRRPLTGSSGIAGAGPIFHAVMLAAQRRAGGREDFSSAIVERPSELIATDVCLVSGMRVGAACPARRSEWLPPDVSPLPCSWHHASEGGLLTLWPDDYRHWAADRGLLDEDRAPSPSVVSAPGALSALAPGRRQFRIVSPPDGAVYLIDPTLRPEFQAVPLRAAGARGKVEWRINGRRVGSASADGQLSWRLRPGRHHVDVRDRQGHSAAATILVK